MNTIKISQEIPFERVQDLLCNAIEGGSNYWYQIDNYIYPFKETKESLNIQFEHIELPFKGGKIIFKDISGETDTPDKEYSLDLQAIKDGLQLMADKFPIHFADFIAENDDAITGDVFLQCCLFNDVIYG